MLYLQRAEEENRETRGFIQITQWPGWGVYRTRLATVKLRRRRIAVKRLPNAVIKHLKFLVPHRCRSLTWGCVKVLFELINFAEGVEDILFCAIVRSKWTRESLVTYCGQCKMLQ